MKKEWNVKATFSLFLKGKKELGRTWSFDRQGPTEPHAAPENPKQFQNVFGSQLFSFLQQTTFPVCKGRTGGSVLHELGSTISCGCAGNAFVVCIESCGHGATLSGRFSAG